MTRARLQPPEPNRASGSMTMAAHWDWAPQQAMAGTAATHFGIHYDRKLTEPGSTAEIAAACERYPDLLVTYACDFTDPAADGFAAQSLVARPRGLAAKNALLDIVEPVELRR